MERPESSVRDEFEQHVATDWPLELWRDLSIVVGVSGGPDSVALLRALHSLRTEHHAGGRLEVAHFNHQWRPKEADQDEQFVRQVCDQLELPLHRGRGTSEEQTEAVARHERLEFLQRVSEQRGARYLVLAHTADDLAETVLHRIIRGTGPRGLRGIPPRRRLSEAVTIIRPLLTARRSEVLSYLARIGQTFRSDSSNSDVRFTRNRIRKELLPHLAEQYNRKIVEALVRLATLAGEATDFIEDHVTRALEQSQRSRSASRVELDRQSFLSQTEFIQREILAAIWRQQHWPEQSMGFRQWQQLLRLIQQQQQADLPGGVWIECDHRTVRLWQSG